MKILVTSDFHGRSKSFEKIATKAEEDNADVMIVCGDVTQFGDLRQVKGLLSILTSLKLPIFYVLGNTDPLASVEEAKIEGATYIHGVCKTYRKTMFLGVGTTTTRQFVTPEEDIVRVLNEGFNNCPNKGEQFVLVSHFPPKNTKLDIAFIGGHVGSLSLRNFIEEKKPTLVLCGHIHESKGVDKIGNTVIVNSGPASHGCYAIADLDGKVEVRLYNGE